MRYPIFIERGNDDYAFGVVVPDLPGCFAAGDTLDEALDNVREAIAAWLESELDNGGTILPPKAIDEHLHAYARWIPSIIEIELNEVLGEAERINISLPKRVLRRLDHQAALANETRSGYIAKLALEHA